MVSFEARAKANVQRGLLMPRFWACIERDGDYIAAGWVPTLDASSSLPGGNLSIIAHWRERRP